MAHITAPENQRRYQVTTTPENWGPVVTQKEAFKTAQAEGFTFESKKVSKHWNHGSWFRQLVFNWKDNRSSDNLLTGFHMRGAILGHGAACTEVVVSLKDFLQYCTLLLEWDQEELLLEEHAALLAKDGNFIKEQALQEFEFQKSSILADIESGISKKISKQKKDFLARIEKFDLDLAF